MISEQVFVTNSKVPPRELDIFSKRQKKTIVVSRLRTIVRISDYWDAVNKFLKTNDPIHLAPFMDDAVVDERGRPHVFETNPRTLYRLSAEL